MNLNNKLVSWVRSLSNSLSRRSLDVSQPSTVSIKSTNYCFTFDERQHLLQECFQTYARFVEMSIVLSRQRRRQTLSDAEVNSLREQYRSGDRYIWKLIQQYKDGVPIIPLSRCPYCQAINYYSFDHYDLDGLWWWSLDGWSGEADSSCRPRERHRLCPHFWTLSGAVHLGSIIPTSPFLVKPGPEVPFVFTHAFQVPSMKVVISRLSVGEHTAYPIVYYSAVKPIRIERLFNEWANNAAILVQEDGRLDMRIDRLYHPPTLAGFSFGSDDFNLTSWIQDGKVLWIAPEDESLTLRQDVESCPYLNLSGRRARLYIQSGKCWTFGND